PPPSTLFPYTTLFRSYLCVHGGDDCEKSHWTGRRQSQSARLRRGQRRHIVREVLDVSLAERLDRSRHRAVEISGRLRLESPEDRSEEHTSELQSRSDL